MLRMVTKELFDSMKWTVDKLVEIEDTILVRQTKSTTKPLFNPAPYKVMSPNNETPQRGSKKI